MSLGIKGRITSRALKKYEHLMNQYSDDGELIQFWVDIVSGKKPELYEMSHKDQVAARLRASELLSKYVFDASFDSVEAEEDKRTKAEMEAMKLYIQAAIASNKKQEEGMNNE